MIQTLPTPAVIAHRGASSYAPENTLSAFKLAVSQKADAIELDVQLSADGKVFIFHDITGQRITSHMGIISKLNFSKIKELDAGAHFDLSFKGEKIPLLSDVLSQDTLLPLNIEMKGFSMKSHVFAERILALIRDYNCSKNVLISSFKFFHILSAYQIAPELNYALILPSLFGTFLMRTGLIRFLPLVSLHIAFPLATQRYISRIHSFGMKAFVYTLNSSRKIRRALAAGADGFFTDNPALGRKTVQDFLGQV
jgi:glycerophosphoryl diester phosphodiesterase